MGKKLENVAIANALQLEAARATPALSGFNYDAMPSYKSQNLYQLLPYYSVYSPYEIWAKSSNPRLNYW